MKYWQDVYHICMHLDKLRDGVANTLYDPAKHGMWRHETWQRRLTTVKQAQVLMEQLATDESGYK
jgi:hypothetical protein